jgi:hypothetical protein
MTTPEAVINLLGYVGCAWRTPKFPDIVFFPIFWFWFFGEVDSISLILLLVFYIVFPIFESTSSDDIAALPFMPS